MQTFLPHSDYRSSAASLDRARLQKQQVETYQILLQLLCLGPDKSDPSHLTFFTRPARWSHPAMTMWSGHEGALLEYQKAFRDEWVSRGYKEMCYSQSKALVAYFGLEAEAWITPSWVGDPEFHRSHQSNLIRKNPEFYSDRFPGVPDNLPYIWPTGRIDLKDRVKQNLSRSQELERIRTVG